MASSLATWMIALAVLGGLTLVAAPVATAQDMQGQLTSDGFGETPEDLPATYQAPVTLEIRSPAQLPCLCTQTVVEFHVTDQPEGIEGTFDPEQITIQWAEVYQEEMSPAGEVTRTVNVSLEVPAGHEGKGAHKATLEAQATNDGGIQGIQVAPTQVTLLFPDAEEDAGGNLSAQSAAEDDGEAETAVPGMGAMAAVIALGAVAWRRRSR